MSPPRAGAAVKTQVIDKLLKHLRTKVREASEADRGAVVRLGTAPKAAAGRRFP